MQPYESNFKTKTVVPGLEQQGTIQSIPIRDTLFDFVSVLLSVSGLDFWSKLELSLGRGTLQFIGISENFDLSRSYSNSFDEIYLGTDFSEKIDFTFIR